MTKIILEPENQGDLMLIKDLAERLNIKYKLESIDKEKRKKHLESVDVSNYGNPTAWQRKVRKDRKLEI